MGDPDVSLGPGEARAVHLSMKPDSGNNGVAILLGSEKAFNMIHLALDEKTLQTWPGRGLP